uniref:Myosin motor domain-containing protein n=1 Tax=Timema genevievae TaxID=629358 RepID=A0A7R9K1V5_TIMGE|nr:unnamed protein product [Timema genevievae]
MDASEIPDQSLVQRIAAILDVTKDLLNDALTKKTIFVQGERVVSPLSSVHAVEARDAFVKGIYGQLFIFIVDKINATIYRSHSVIKNSIGVLDIFGFENFEVTWWSRGKVSDLYDPVALMSDLLSLVLSLLPP